MNNALYYFDFNIISILDQDINIKLNICEIILEPSAHYFNLMIKIIIFYQINSMIKN